MRGTPIIGSLTNLGKLEVLNRNRKGCLNSSLKAKN